MTVTAPNAGFIEIYLDEAGGTGKVYEAVVGSSTLGLRCSTCNTNWCAHIEAVVTDHLDASFIWVEKQGGRFDLQVPVFPTKDLWATCSLSDPQAGGMKLHFLAGVQLEETFLGFVSPGEGRNVMRQMILDWFEPRAFDNHDDNSDKLFPPHCKAEGHTFAAQMAWEQTFGNDDTYMLVAKKKANHLDKLMQLFSVFQTGLCLYCLAGTEDFGDLVPSEEYSKSRGFPRR